MFGFGKPKPVPPPAQPARPTSRWVVRSEKDCTRGTYTKAYRSRDAALRASLRMQADSPSGEMFQSEKWTRHRW